MCEYDFTVWLFQKSQAGSIFRIPHTPHLPATPSTDDATTGPAMLSQTPLLGLTRKQLLALDAVLEIALGGGGGSIDSSDLSERHGIPRRYLEPMLQRLGRAGILVGTRGRKGGYRLARERRKVTVRDLLLALAGDETVDPDLEREIRAREGIASVIVDLQAEMLTRLGEITIEDLARRSAPAAPPRRPPEGLDFSI